MNTAREILKQNKQNNKVNNSTRTLIPAVVTSCIDYCNAVLVGSPRFITNKCNAFSMLQHASFSTTGSTTVASQSLILATQRLAQAWCYWVYSVQAWHHNAPMTTRQDKASTYLVEHCANLCVNLCENLQTCSISDQPIDTI